MPKVGTEMRTGERPQFVKSSIPDLSEATIERFIETASISDDCSILLSVPAGPNRARNFIPTVQIASELHRQLPSTKLSIDLAIDTNEAMREIAEATPDEGIPSSSKIQEYFPDLEVEGVSIEPRLQEVCNSVLETRIAMHEAAKAGVSHLVAPRFGRPLASRVGRGLRHYSPEVEGSSLKVVAAPAHALHEDTAPGRSKRIALEWASYIVGELAHRLGGSSFYEQYTERKGIFEKLSRKAQEIKLRSFERGEDAKQKAS